jgi:hypothetical protein
LRRAIEVGYFLSMDHGKKLSVLTLLGASLAACPGGTSSPEDTGVALDVADVVMVDTFRDTTVIAPFDAGPLPACEETASAWRVVDRPGGDRLSDPAQMLAVDNGFLVSARYIEERFESAGDGGAGDASPDGAIVPVTVLADRAIVIPLAEDGTARPAVTLLDGASAGTTLSPPRLHRTLAGALALFQEIRGNASSPDFMLRLHGAVIGNDGVAGPARVLRERVSQPDSTAIAAGIFGTASRIESVGDGGIVAATPISFLLDAQGGNVRPADNLLTSAWPLEIFEQRMRTRPDNGAVLVYRGRGTLSFIPFNGQGVPEATGTYDVLGTTIPTLDDAAAVGDAVIAAWSRNIAGTTEVHVIVAGLDHRLRLDRELERFSGEGPTVVTVVPAYGGAALLWRRGVDGNARVRVAVVAPDATVRVAPTDLVAAPNLEGRIAAVADGRRLSFVARDGIRADRWGFTFGRACLPSP